MAEQPNARRASVAEHENSEIQRLQTLMGDDPGAAAFPALAEAWRRSGAAERGLEIARAGLARRPDAVDGRVALGLALLDLGQTDEARHELEAVLAVVSDHPVAAGALELHGEGRPWQAPPPAPATDHLLEPIGEPEIDAAFDQATPERDEPVTADDVVAEAVHHADLGGLETVGGAEDDLDLPVATHTVADLLESQGHDQHARAMRATLGDEPDDDPDGERARILATLERWLENLRRDPA